MLRVAACRVPSLLIRAALARGASNCLMQATRCLPASSEYKQSILNSLHYGVGNRTFASVSETTSSAKRDFPLLSQSLRKLFLKVHPDLVKPEMKATNSGSFAVLTNFIDSLKSGQAAEAQDVVFYVRKGEEDYDKIKVTLGVQNAKLQSVSARKQIHASLQELFGAAGINRDFLWGDAFDAIDPTKSATNGEIRYAVDLESFVRSVREAAHKLMSERRAMTQGFNVAMANLRVQGVKLMFEGDVTLDAEEQAAVLQKFHRLLDKLPYPSPRSLNKSSDNDSNADNDTGFSDRNSANGSSDVYRRKQYPGQASAAAQSKAQRAAEAVDEIKRAAAQASSNSQTQTDPFANAAWARFTDHTHEERSPFPGAEHAKLDKYDFTLPGKMAGHQLQGSPFTQYVSIFSVEAKTSYVDARGRLVFAIQQEEEEWLKFVKTGVFELAERRQAAWRFSKTKEAEVAKKTGIFTLFSEPELLSSTDYVTFLETLEKEAPSFQDLFAKNKGFTEIPLRVQRLPKFNIDPQMGVMSVPVDWPADRVIWFLQSRGAEALHYLQRFKKQGEAYNNASLDVKRKLRLAALERDPEHVTLDRMMECCKRLLACSSSVKSLLDGLPLRIIGNDKHFALDERGFLNVPANWR